MKLVVKYFVVLLLVQTNCNWGRQFTVEMLS